ncbi:MAG: DHH family phosphoesterase [Pseudomonadota bacterium]
MTAWDVFNGDADGICALIQLRLDQPRDAQLVTGVKRDINLLSRVDAGAEDQVTALDISLDKNREGLLRLLEAGAQVLYLDHHFAGDIPEHAGLTCRINTQPNVCTSLLAHREVSGRWPLWALVGTAGDNLDTPARELAKKVGTSEADFDRLRRLGICVNYNAYGASLDDLYFTPEALYQKLVRYESPLEFLAQDAATFERLATGYDDDLGRAAAASMLYDQPHAQVKLLPDAAWARRVSGVYGNALANEAPQRAHAVVTDRGDTLLVSVRAPLERKAGADEVCRQFDTGGGRAAAAGINALPRSELDRFIETFQSHYS